MILRENWMWVKLEEQAKSSLVIPGGAEAAVRDEIAVFDIMQIGREVRDCRVGDKVILFAAMGSLAYFSYENVKYYVTKEADVIAIMNRSENHQKPKSERSEVCKRST